MNHEFVMKNQYVTHWSPLSHEHDILQPPTTICYSLATISCLRQAWLRVEQVGKDGRIVEGSQTPVAPIMVGNGEPAGARGSVCVELMRGVVDNS